MTIIPAILSDSFMQVKEQIERVRQETKLTRIQIDIVDPDFADDITISPIDLAEVKLQGLEVDLHLMTNDPINEVVECSEIKNIHAIIGQVEHMSNQRDFIEHVHSYNLKVGLALDLTTPITAIEANIWADLDMVQVMGIRAGAQGQSFKLETLEKVKEIRQKYPQLEILVDGGVKPENMVAINAAGASTVVVGSYLWESRELTSAIAKLTSAR